MKIFFYNSGNPKLGSNRIYIDNLSYWLAEINVKTIVSNDLTKSKDCDIIILNKFTKYNKFKELKSLNAKNKIGLIHPSDLNHEFIDSIKYIDFFITGSIEETDHYLSYKKNIFRFPQIEKVNLKLKNHHNNEPFITIGYHGNLEHLNEMDNNVKTAIEKISKNYKIKLVVVYDMSLGKWTKGRPNVDIKEVNWTFQNMIDEMSKVDIGIVPCTNKFILDKHYNSSIFFTKIIKKLFGRSNDYNIQFKVTSNSGRAFIFHQLGIPVIADFWPSNFEILDNNKNGFLAHSSEAWYYALEKLITSSDLRNLISNNAQKEFLNKYDPIIWSRAFLNFLEKL